MLDKYKSQQPVAYRILKNAINDNQCSHAYLFQTTGFYESFDFTMSFVKSLLCPNQYFIKENCQSCHQCEVIDSGNFPEIKIINPDGMWIKKEQLQELQAEFNTKAIIGNKRVYIINHAERLNASSANSILKFLEEPDNNLVAILLTDNIYSVLPTIRSRCQILRLKETQIKENANYLETLKTIIFKTNEINEENELQINKTIDFVNYYEKNHLTTLLYLNKIWNDYIKTKEDFLNAYQIMILYYKDILNFKLNKNLEIFSSNENIKEISNHNTINEICQKINIIIKLSDNIKYNANTNLLMDKLIISLEGGI